MLEVKIEGLFIGTVYSMEWSLGAEFWSGLASDFGMEYAVPFFTLFGV